MGQRRNYFGRAREEKRERERNGLSVTLERVYPLSPSPNHLWLPPPIHLLHLVYPRSFRSFLLFVLVIIVFFGTMREYNWRNNREEVEGLKLLDRLRTCLKKKSSKVAVEYQ